ncbi:MAG: tRNA (guanosine(37)-N1)-methyltransferase TrmD [Legionellaceae bacterium]|nr:tRNA (guanosine(37)-N1)-methyltransferase TrmD [Legionellaceae bacterium]
MSLCFGVVSLLPEMFAALQWGVCGRALQNKLIQVEHYNPRDWSKRAYRQVDDKPFGGGPGMVMMYEPLQQAIMAAKKKLAAPVKTVYLSPQGQVQTQGRLAQLVAERQPILFVAGRYEGIDERIITRHVDEEWSLGDFVLSGGELAAMVYIDAMVRLLPGVLGHSASAEQDSFMQGILDHPHYTRPAVVDGMGVPEVLLKGNHRDITRWRRQQALGKTWQKRPDLLKGVVLSDDDEQLLKEFINEQHELL